MLGIRVVSTAFTSEGEVLRGDFVLPPGDGPFPGVCKFHGLPGSRDQVSGVASRLASAGFVVLTFDFRGFRRSDGVFRLSGMIEDAKNAVTHLLESGLSTEGWLGAYGASYGGAVAVCSAVRDERISCVCIRAPVYDTLAFARSSMIQPAVNEVVRTDPDGVHGLADSRVQKQILEWMVKDGARFNPINEISKISPRPLFIIAGDEDGGIDLAGVQRLFELAGEPKEFVVVEGADHGLTDPKAYETTIHWVLAWFRGQKPRSIDRDLRRAKRGYGDVSHRHGRDRRT
ncbi:MAG: alpha/beta hydrolase [Aigarchaeota archaeon]|nr:alpha/beta hydrolase [Aigarchaeota archaeon]